MNKEMIDYDIFIEDSKAILVEKVTTAMRSGWQPYGFMEVKGEYQYTSYIQAMVKYKKQ